MRRLATGDLETVNFFRNDAKKHCTVCSCFRRDVDDGERTHPSTVCIHAGSAPMPELMRNAYPKATVVSFFL